MSEKKLTREEQLALKEYEFGDKLRSDYFKHCWIATSILLPVCFSFLALSYTESLSDLQFKLIPLALASIFVYFVWFWYDWRYSGHIQTIFGRLQTLEETTLKSFDLHKRIKREDPTEEKSKEYMKLGKLKWIILVVLIFVWFVRIVFWSLL